MTAPRATRATVTPDVKLLVCISEQVMRYSRTGRMYGKTAYGDVEEPGGGILFPGSHRGRSNRMVEDAALDGRRTLVTWKGRDGHWTRPVAGIVRIEPGPPAGGDPKLRWFRFVRTEPRDARAFRYPFDKERGKCGRKQGMLRALGLEIVRGSPQTAFLLVRSPALAVLCGTGKGSGVEMKEDGRVYYNCYAHGPYSNEVQAGGDVVWYRRSTGSFAAKIQDYANAEHMCVIVNFGDRDRDPAARNGLFRHTGETRIHPSRSYRLERCRM